MNLSKTYVIKRDGSNESISFDKVLYRIKNLCALPEDLNLLMKKSSENYQINKKFKSLPNVDYNLIAQKTINGIYPGVTTKELDDLAASIAQPLAFDHPDYGILASRILVSNYHKNTLINLQNHFKIDPEEVEKNIYFYTAKALYENIDSNGIQYPLLTPEIYKIIMVNKEQLENLIDYNLDYEYDFMGIKMLEESYLQKCSLTDKEGTKFRTTIERTQHSLMRITLGIHCCGEYRDYDKMRRNDKYIFEIFLPILEKYLNDENIKKYTENAKKNTIVWQEIIQIIKDQIPCSTDENSPIIVDLNELEDFINKNTLSWNDLLDKYDGKLTPNQWENIQETYYMMSEKYFTHATPTRFNAGTLKPQLSSCFLIQLPFDSIDGITDFWKICAEISKWAGGIGCHVHIVRCQGSYIRGTNGNSNGLTYMLKVLNEESLYIDQGGGRRPGSNAVYAEPWHGDIFEVLSLKKNRGSDSERARNLFYAMWLCDEFFRTIEYEFKLEKQLTNKILAEKGKITKEDEEFIRESIKSWYLMCPDKSKNLSNLYDEKFVTEWISDEALLDNNSNQKDLAFTYQYRKYISENKYVKKVSAISLWKHICEIIEETGIPYMTLKDASNRKSNQKNLGTIKSSNLCVAPETLILTDKGYLKIADLKDQFVNVWNGQEWSKVQVKQTSERAELIKVKLSNNLELECTREHEFIIDTKDRDSYVKVKAGNLTAGLILVNFKLPNVIVNDNDVPHSYTHEHKFITVQEVITTGRYDKTYCFTEPKRHMGVFNGLLLGQCTEIMQYSSPQEIAVCNLSSTNMTRFIVNKKPAKNTIRSYTEKYGDGFESSLDILIRKNQDAKSIKKYIDWNQYEKVIRTQVRNLNKVINVNYYPVPQARYSNLKHRPIAIGIQDFANLLTLLRLPFDSEQALELNFYLFEFMYYVACDESCNLAIKHRRNMIDEYSNEKEFADRLSYFQNVSTSGSYETFIGSPASQGDLQFDLWIKEQMSVGKNALRYMLTLDWETLKEKIKMFGLRNSLLLALMPTGSTSTIMNCSPCFEPHNALIYKRRNKLGEFSIVNRYLIEDLMSINLWNKNIQNELLLSNKGGVSEISQLPLKFRDLYKTVWDISPKSTSDMCLVRGVFIDNSQSYTVFMSRPTVKLLTQFHFYNWRRGAKTSSYYTRRLPVADAKKLQVEAGIVNQEVKSEIVDEVCTFADGCKSCGS